MKDKKLLCEEVKENKITRVEVINQFGRQYVGWNLKDVELSYQDDNRTLKIFVKDDNKVT